MSRGADKRLAEGCEPHLDLIGRVEKIVAEGRFSRERLDAAFESLFMHPFPLHRIGEFGDKARLVKPLVALGYDVNALSDQHGMHPLHIPALYGRTELVRALIRAGADRTAGRVRQELRSTTPVKDTRTLFDSLSTPAPMSEPPSGGPVHF